MKWTRFIAALLALNQTRSSAEQHTGHDPLQNAVDVTNDLAICMLQVMATPERNVAFSPYGLATASLLVYEGSRGPSATQIHAALRLPWDRHLTRVGFRDLHRHLRSYFTTSGFLRGLVLSTADVRLRQDYSGLLRFYGFDPEDSPATVGQVDLTTSYGEDPSSSTAVTSTSVTPEVEDNRTVTSRTSFEPTATVDSSKAPATILPEEKTEIITPSLVTSDNQEPMPFVMPQTDAPNGSLTDTPIQMIKTTTPPFVNTQTEAETTTSSAYQLLATTNSPAPKEESKIPILVNAQEPTSSPLQSFLATTKSSALVADESKTPTHVPSTPNEEPNKSSLDHFLTTVNPPGLISEENRTPTPVTTVVHQLLTPVPAVMELVNTPPNPVIMYTQSNTTTSNVNLLTTNKYQVDSVDKSPEKPFPTTQTNLLGNNNTFSIALTTSRRPNTDTVFPITDAIEMEMTTTNVTFITDGATTKAMGTGNTNTSSETAIGGGNTTENWLTDSIVLRESTNTPVSLATENLTATTKAMTSNNWAINDTTLSMEANLLSAIVPGFTSSPAAVDFIYEGSTTINPDGEIPTDIMSTLPPPEVVSYVPGTGTSEHITQVLETTIVSEVENSSENTSAIYNSNVTVTIPKFTTQPDLFTFTPLQTVVPELSGVVATGAFTSVTDIREPIGPPTSATVSTDSQIELSALGTVNNEPSANQIDWVFPNDTRKQRSVLPDGDAANWISASGGLDAPESLWFFSLLGGGRSVPVVAYTASLPFTFVPELDALVLQLPLDDDRYTMLVLLPAERRGLKQLIDALQWCPLRRILESLVATPVSAVVPTFTIVRHVDLTTALKQLGMRYMFDPYLGDLSAMAESPRDLHVRAIEQVVTVSLRQYYNFDNQRAAERVEQHFVANHPFVYFVIDTETKAALMAGTVVDPSIG